MYSAHFKTEVIFWLTIKIVRNLSHREKGGRVGHSLLPRNETYRNICVSARKYIQYILYLYFIHKGYLYYI